MPTRTTKAFATSSLVAAALLLSGCATSTEASSAATSQGSSSSAESSEAVFNGVDSMFVTMMIPHHEQAIMMADQLLAKDNIDPQVIELAEQIKAAQGPEIETMKAWLEAWGMPYDDSVSESMSGMDHGGGMMSEEDMAALDTATGAEATRLFLVGMIAHHEGAVQMAEPVLESGENPEVRELAQQIIDGQTAEIETMQQLLGSL